VLGDKFIKAFPVPFKQEFNIAFRARVTGKVSLQLINALGKIIETEVLETTNDQFYLLTFPRKAVLSAGVYFVKYYDGKDSQTIKVMK
jgi:type IX secretion system substrate protein